METWYSMPLNDSYALSDKQRVIIDNCPPTVGLFYGEDSEYKPQLFVSPNGLSTALALGARPCDTPDLKRLTEVPSTKGNYDLG